MKKQKMFINMGDSIPGGNFLGGSFPGELTRGENLIDGNFLGGVFLILFVRYFYFVVFMTCV